MPKVSVIVPVYNTEKYLRRCMDSLTAQTLRELEIILVDDGSKEECALLCDALAKEDPRIKVIHKKNAGLGYARNTGLEAATGEYVGFVDSDDYIALEMYERLYSAAVANQADLVISGMCFVGGNIFGKADEYIEKPCFSEEAVFERDGMKQLLLGVVGALPREAEDSRYGFSVCKNLFRRAVIQEQGLEFLSERVILSEDVLFLVDFIKKTTRAVGVPGAYYGYCRNGASLSKSYRVDKLEKTMVFLKAIEERICDFVDKSEYQIYLNRLSQSLGRVLCSQEIMHAKAEKIRFSALRRTLKAICTKEEIANVLKTYPWYQLPIKQAVFAFAMRYKLYMLQKILVTLRDR